MTIVVAVHTPAGGIIASDSQFTMSSGAVLYTGPKWVVTPHAVIGYSGNLKTANIIEQMTSMAIQTPHEFVAEWRSRAKSLDWEGGAKDKADPPAWDLNFLFLNRHGLFYVTGDLGVLTVPSGKLSAIGSGSPEARGAALAYQRLVPNIHHFSAMARLSVEAAIELDSGCGGDIHLGEFNWNQ